MKRSRMMRAARHTAAELVTIVLGILLALWIDGQVTNRAERKLEASYMRSLHADLLSDSVSLAKALAVAERQRHAAVMIRDTLIGSSQPTGDFLMRFLEAGDLRQFRPRRLTFDELRETGNMRLVRNRELLRRAVDYYQAAELSPLDEDLRQRTLMNYVNLLESELGSVFSDPGFVRHALDDDATFKIHWSGPGPFPIRRLRQVAGLEDAVGAIRVLAAADAERLKASIANNTALLELSRLHAE